MLRQSIFGALVALFVAILPTAARASTAYDRLDAVLEARILGHYRVEVADQLSWTAPDGAVVTIYSRLDCTEDGAILTVTPQWWAEAGMRGRLLQVWDCMDDGVLDDSVLLPAIQEGCVEAGYVPGTCWPLLAIGFPEDAADLLEMASR